MKKAILTLVFIVSFFSLFFVPENPSTGFFIGELLKALVFVYSGRKLDSMKAN